VFKKYLKTIIVLAILAFPTLALAALGDHCTYPTTLDTFTERAANYLVTANDWNKVQCALDALESYSGPVDIFYFQPAKPTAGTTVFFAKFVRPISCPDDFSGGYATALTASASTAVYTVYKNAGSIGTITFSTSATGVISLTGSQTFAAGDTLKITAPNPQDANLAGVQFSFACSR